MGGPHGNRLPCGEPGRLPSVWPTSNTSANFKHLGGGGPLGSAHAVVPTSAATINRLRPALDNLALAAANNTTVLQQLMASNLGLTTLVTMLTAANKKLAEVLAKAKLASPPAATPGTPRPLQSTNTPFPGNYCWKHGGLSGQANLARCHQSGQLRHL